LPTTGRPAAAAACSRRLVRAASFLAAPWGVPTPRRADSALHSSALAVLQLLLAPRREAGWPPPPAAPPLPQSSVPAAGPLVAVLEERWMQGCSSAEEGPLQGRPLQEGGLRQGTPG
jgi:hypothetical protein